MLFFLNSSNSNRRKWLKNTTIFALGRKAYRLHQLGFYPRTFIRELLFESFNSKASNDTVCLPLIVSSGDLLGDCFRTGPSRSFAASALQLTRLQLAEKMKQDSLGGTSDWLCEFDMLKRALFNCGSLKTFSIRVFTEHCSAMKNWEKIETKLCVAHSDSHLIIGTFASKRLSSYPFATDYSSAIQKKSYKLSKSSHTQFWRQQPLATLCNRSCERLSGVAQSLASQAFLIAGSSPTKSKPPV